MSPSFGDSERHARLTALDAEDDALSDRLAREFFRRGPRCLLDLSGQRLSVDALGSALDEVLQELARDAQLSLDEATMGSRYALVHALLEA